jgi:hypothetical protein
MQYALLIYEPPDSLRLTQPEEREKIHVEYMKYTADLQAAGAIRGGAPLQTADTATTVRVRNGEISTTDGPFAETKEWLVGYFLVECGSSDEALDWAAKIPGARYGSIEVRPLMEIPAPATR